MNIHIDKNFYKIIKYRFGKISKNLFNDLNHNLHKKQSAMKSLAKNNLNWIRQIKIYHMSQSIALNNISQSNKNPKLRIKQLKTRLHEIKKQILVQQDSAF